MKITVCTPTYNRGYILSKLYNSLKSQTSTDFEWLIIDDGSNDDTEQLVENWKKENNPFIIRYHKQKNGGKGRAINRALHLAHGKLFLVIDSDDYLINTAIERIIEWESDISVNNNFCGVSGNLGITENFTNNTLFETDYYDGTMLDRYKNVNGERAYAFYTDIHKQYLYPEFEGEKFITEAVTWNRMAHDGYKMRFYNDILCVYKYLDDGLTMAGYKLFLQNPHGYALWLKEQLQFSGKASLINRLKLLYGLCNELYPAYNVKIVSECLDTETIIVILLVLVFRIKHFMDKK